MKTVKDFLAEANYSSMQQAPKRTPDEEREIAFNKSALFFAFKFQGWLFKSSIHAASQAYDRRPDMSEKDWKDMHKNVSDALLKMDKVDSAYMFFSKKYDQGYIAAVDFTKKRATVITMLPKGRSFAKPGTISMMVEGIDYPVEIITVE